MAPQTPEVVKTTYRGEAFENGRLPADAFSSFDDLARLITVVAKNLYFKNNPGRRRLPRNFDRDYLGLHLRADGFESNCFSARLFSSALPFLPLAGIQNDYPQAATQIITDAVFAEFKPSENSLNPASQYQLFRFLSFIEDDRSLELKIPSRSTAAEITSRTKALVRKRLRERQYWPNATIYGRVVRVDDAECVLKTSEGLRLHIPYPRNQAHDVRAVAHTADQYSQTHELLISGNFWAEPRSQSRTLRIDYEDPPIFILQSAFDIEPVSEDRALRLINLIRLNDSLRGRTGYIRLPAQAEAFGLKLLGELSRLQIPAPLIFLDEPDKLVVEWQSSAGLASIEFGFDDLPILNVVLNGHTAGSNSMVADDEAKQIVFSANAGNISDVIEITLDLLKRVYL